MSKLILLNGPKLCGKNVAVDFLKRSYPLVDRRCKDHLEMLVCEYFGIKMEQYLEVYEDRSKKESPSKLFPVLSSDYFKLCKYLQMEAGKVCLHPNEVIYLSVREAMIFISEVVIKPLRGKDFFGKMRAEAIRAGEIAIDDSCGFAEELPPVIEALGQKNLLLIRIKGRGDFVGDSRSYIEDGVINNTVDVENKGTEEEYLNKIQEAVEGFLSPLDPASNNNG